MGLGGGPFGRCWGQESGARMSGIRALIQRLQRSLSLLLCEDTVRRQLSANQKVLTRHWICPCRALGLAASRPWEINSCCVLATQPVEHRQGSPNGLRRARHWARHLYYNDSNSMRWLFLLLPFYMWETWGTERLSDLPKVAQLVTKKLFTKKEPVADRNWNVK